MQFNQQMLNAVTATGSSAVITPPAPSVFTQSFLSAAGGTATVLLEVTNDPRAVSDPTNAVWVNVPSATMTLSGINATAGTATSYAPWGYVRFRVSAISGGAVVSGYLSC